MLSESQGEHGGYREVISRVVGRGVYLRLKFESGTHRVQRVPATEAQGRIHTSACTVAILPELDEVDEIDPEPGGPAHRHVPLLGRGRPAREQDGLGDPHHAHADRDRGRVPGRALAAQEPLARDVAAALAPAAGRAAEAGGAAGAGAQAAGGQRRSLGEASAPTTIPQGRVTDHRINLTLYQLPAVMEGALDERHRSAAAGMAGGTAREPAVNDPAAATWPPRSAR